MKKILTLAVVLLAALSTWAGEPLWQTLGKARTVKGGAGIEQFVEAILDTKRNEWSREAVYDKKSGYFYYREEGAGSVDYYVSYWNRNDGKKLVVLSYRCSDFGQKIPALSSPWGYRDFNRIEAADGDEGVIEESGFRCYLYDEGKKQLVPLQTPPVNNFPNPQKSHYLLQLPQQGKDIRVRETVGEYDYVYHTMKWNGMGFDFVKENGRLVDFYFLDANPNVRSAPNGKVVRALKGVGASGVTIIKIENGWCLLEGNTIYDYETSEVTQLSGSTTGYWVHSSCIGATGMGAGGVTLYATPDSNAKVVFKSEDETQFQPVEIRGEWIKVRVSKNVEGWMKINEICSNPLTNCC